MRKYQFSRAVKFKPWVKIETYERQPIRILLIGESHFANDRSAKNRQLTNTVVGNAQHGKSTMKNGKRFFTNAAALLNGHLLNEHEVREWWPKVAFYNYIQAPVGEKPRTHLNLDRFDEAHDAFHEVLKVLDPELVVVLGHRTWDYMSAKDARQTESLAVPEIQDRYRELWEYATVGGRTALVVHVKHPSAGFNFRIFQGLMRECQRRAK